jgi:hypothetical protein
MAARTAPVTRSILVNRQGQEPLIVDGIPANAKITFGALQPGKDSFDRTKALRIYTTANNQLAVFTGVESFRDLSLKVRERRVLTNSESTSVVDPDGSHKSSEVSVSYEWAEVAD